MKQILLVLLSLLVLPSCSKEEINSTVTDPPTEVEPPSTDSLTRMRIIVGDTSFSATLNDNATVAAFKSMLPLTLAMSDFNNNEKVSSLPRSLPTAASNPGMIRTGDVMLYGAGSLVVFYETFSTSYTYTRIGRIEIPTELKAVLGTGNVTLKFELE